MLAQGQAGVVLVQDGGQLAVRQGRQGEVVVGDAHGRYAEGVFRGQTFLAANNASVTVTALAAINTGFCLLNPAGSGRILSILNIAGNLGTVAVTAETMIGLAGSVNPVAAAVTQTSKLTVRAALLSGSGAAVGVACDSSTLPALPVWIRPLLGLNWVTAGTGTTQCSFNDDTAGQIALAPGTAVSIQGVAASAGVFSMVWEELPFIS